MSKRFLRRLVEEGYVSGWDDPRMPTLAGMRRRGYTSAAVRDFIDRVGVSKADSVVDVRLLEYCVRNDLNETAPRAMAVLDPVKVVLTNYEEGKTEDCVIENHPKKPEMGTHTLPLTREIYIEREDFMVDAPKKFFRLKPDGEVRLKGAYIIKCERYDVDENGSVTCIYCSVDFTSKSGSEGADRKVKGTIHWVSAEQNVPFEGRLYDVLMRDDEPLGAAPAEGEEDGEEEKRRTRKRLYRPPESGFAEGHSRLCRAVSGGSKGRRQLPVPAHGLLLQGQGFHRCAFRVQPRRSAEGQLQARVSRGIRMGLCPIPRQGTLFPAPFLLYRFAIKNFNPY